MFAKILDRDGLVMVTLIVVGVALAGAGVISGRSTFEHVLIKDATRASQAWVSKAEAYIGRLNGKKGSIFSNLHGLMETDPREWFGHRGKSAAGATRAGDARSAPPPAFLAELDPANAGQGSEVEHNVSRIRAFAILNADRKILTRSRAFSGRDFAAIIDRQEFSLAFDSARDTRQPQTITLKGARDGSDYRRYVVVPVFQDGALSRVYLIKAEQTLSPEIADTALGAVSLVTGLLILIGFLMPAIIAARRIRERWTAEDQMRFLAMHDPLTGLANRVQLHKRLEEAAARAQKNGTLMGLFWLDLDRFKDINDTLGHPTGDKLLESVAQNLRASVRESDLVSRIGGDEFAIVAENLESPEEAVVLATRIGAAAAAPCEVEGREIASSASIGIALAGSRGDTPETLLKNADLALYRAKNDGRNTFRFYEQEMDTIHQERLRLEQDLRLAMRNDELRVHYQPKHDLATGAVAGYEALLRWRHPTRGELEAGEFLPLAEEAGLSAEISEWAMRTACTYAAGWPRELTLSLNVSRSQFMSHNLALLVARILSDTGLSPHRVEIEVSEAQMLKDSAAVGAMIEELAALGVTVVMDQFGAGYSSLSHLTRLPIRKIKIDRSFVARLDEGREPAAIIDAICRLGRSLNLTIAAGGIEALDQVERFRDWGCGEVQGYALGRPAATIGSDAFALPDSTLADSTLADSTRSTQAAGQPAAAPPALREGAA